MGENEVAHHVKTREQEHADLKERHNDIYHLCVCTAVSRASFVVQTAADGLHLCLNFKLIQLRFLEQVL